MKTIKFRAKRLDNDKWVYGYYFITPLTDENSGLSSDKGWFFLSDGQVRHCISQDNVAYVIDQKTLGQFTGLLDKNGKEIYEGDIVKSKNSSIWLITFFSGSFGAELKTTDIKTVSDWLSCSSITFQEMEFEVIRNIYTNNGGIPLPPPKTI